MTSGVYVPNITFFTKEGDVDLKKTQAHMRWMIEKGVDGFDREVWKRISRTDR